MSYKDSNKKSQGEANKSPLDSETFELIQSGEASKATTKEYLAKIENFLFDDKNIDHPDYLEIQSQLDLVAEFLESFPDDSDSDHAKTLAASSNSSKRLRCTEEELDKEVTAIIENENLTAEKLQGALTYLSDRIGMHPLELEKYYRAKKDTIENQGHLEEVKKEVDSILKLEKAGLKLEEVIPSCYADLIYDYCEELGIRPEACFTSLISGFSACHRIGTEIILARRTGYRQHPAIFAAIVANPGSMKSEIRKRFAVKPLLGLQKDMIDQFGRAEKERKETELEYRSMSKDERNAAYPEGLPEFPERSKAIFIDDPTFEGLALNFFHYQDQAILYSRDELKGIFDSLNKYRGGKGSDEAQLLSLYDGDGFSINRASGGTIFVERTALSIFGTIQPFVLASLWGDGQDTNGMFSRFNYCWQPDVCTLLNLEDDDYEDCPLDEPLKTLFTRAYATEPKTYFLSAKAYRRYANYYNFLSKRAIKESNPIIQHALNKAKGQCGRYILNLHLLESLGNKPTEEVSLIIETEAVDRAIKVSQFFLEQVELLHKTLCDTDSQFGKFRKILAFSERLGWIKARDLIMGERSLRKTDSNLIRDWFLELENLGYGEVKGRGTRLKFRTLPKNCQQFANNPEKS
ncbi:hypothetical protein Xen7305DRAFT_00046640 [Xenococcus sp. PCC 7305]|uniref:DUF3987 domain-containing protein n=1 Tax=Xenococcus sp. PCC 7305 TaxID=102125 RepID=UPI0002ACB972|nr:DUF3987 domain-containing protein [Xenococcus sp. PCC 7305]ELS04928.1 hypothetical protein Xen7305DRAFT_00046640 [Xenococcus sp. PCC 7305]